MNMGALSKPVGPLPLGVWLAAVGGSLGIASAVKLKGGGKPPAKSKSTVRVLRNEDVPYGYTAPLQSPVEPGPFGLAPAPGGPPAQRPIETNVDWQRAATTILIGRGFQPYIVQQALAKYLSGTNQLTTEEQAIVDAAMQWVGVPPDPPNDVGPVLPPSAPPTQPYQGGGQSLRMYWIGGAVYITDGVRRSTWGLLPAQVDALRKQGVPLSGRAGGVPVPDQQFHDATPAATYEQIVRISA